MATLEQIQARLKKLQLQADALIAKKAQVAVDQIRALMLKHGLTTEDIEAKAKAKRDARATKGTGPGVARKGVAKYLDKKTGASWTGHGRAPAWIANVKDRSKFLVDSGADVALDAGAALVSKASKAVHAGASKGQRKGPQPAKYRDPKTGATWSGRGPAPVWLASVKDRTRFLIDAANGAASGVVAKKASAKKVAAKKTTAKKAVAVKKSAAVKKAAAKAPAAVKKAAVKKTSAKTAGRKTAGKAIAAPAASADATPAASA